MRIQNKTEKSRLPYTLENETELFIEGFQEIKKVFLRNFFDGTLFKIIWKLHEMKNETIIRPLIWIS